MKKCFRCKIIKDFNEFSPSAQHKDGYRGICKRCRSEEDKLSRIIDGSKERRRSQRYRLNNPETRKETCKKYRQSGKAKISAIRYLKTEKARKTRKKHSLLRRERLKTQRLKIRIPLKIIKSLIKDLSNKTSIEYCVDHIVPLANKDVCGLHVPWNIQIVPLIFNMEKGNRHFSR